MSKNALYSQRESSISESLQEFLRVIDELKFIKYLYRVYQYSDEPKIYQYFTQIQYFLKGSKGKISIENGGGCSLFSEDHALLKSIGEAIERYASVTYKRSNLIKGSYDSLSKEAINPLDFEFFSKDQLSQEKFIRFRVSSNAEFTWVWGRSLHSNKRILIPAQLVYYSYFFRKNEAILELPISTGSAGGGCLAAAIVRGIYEIVERDSFMIGYLNKLANYVVDLSKMSDKRISVILDTMRRYRLELYVIDTSTDLGIPSFASIIIDRSGIGQAVHVGLRADLNPIEAIVGAVHESLQGRKWMRTTSEDRRDEFKHIDPKNITTLEQRGMYWSQVDKIKKLDFWLRQKSKSLIWRKQKNYPTAGQTLKKLSALLKEKEVDVYYTDITPSKLRFRKYKVVKVVIPKLQPLYLDERYPYFGSERLNKHSQTSKRKSKSDFKFNDVPHPLL